jgi:hypothetical protein
MDLVLANLAFGGYGHVEIDVAVAGVKVDVCARADAGDIGSALDIEADRPH